MAVITLPSNAGRSASFQLVRAQDTLDSLAGTTQITSYPDRRWILHLQIVQQRGALLRQWSLAMEQLSDRTNVFAYGPPYYSGPSTGYAGAGPLVNGASQLGLSLVCDGVTPSAAILLAGDFLSFDVTSPGGATNRQLNKVIANATADGGGNVTFSLMLPIRQAPAENAAVNIFTPTAQFMLAQSRGGPEDIDVLLRSGFTLDAIEQVLE